HDSGRSTMRRNRIALRILKFLLLAVVGLAVIGALVMLLWNHLVPTLFGAHTITFWQALGLLLLARILVGGFRGGRGMGGHWRHRMMERWSEMTPEEREQFRTGMRGRHCGRGGRDR